MHLLGGNVPGALVGSTNVHHQAAQTWVAASDKPFATCTVTQGTLLPLLMRLGEVSSDTAFAVFAGVTAHARHRFCSDSLGYAEISWRGVLGHRQVIDAYRAALARHHGGRLVSFDAGRVELDANVAVGLTQVAALDRAFHRRRLAAPRCGFQSKLRSMAPLSTFPRDT